MKRTQPAGTIKDFANLLERAESLLDRLEVYEVPFFNERRKLRTHIQEALGMRPSKARDEGEGA